MEPQTPQQPVPNEPQVTMPDAPAPPTVTSTPPPPINPTENPTSAVPNKAQQLRSALIKTMLVCVVGAATVAVTAVLAGGLGDVGLNAIWTVLSAMLHVAILFGVVSTTETKDPREQRSTNIVVNTSMVLAVLSFFTSVLGIWGVVDGGIAGRLYATYVVILFLILHGKTLMDAQAAYEKVKPYVYANYALMMLVAALLLGAVYAPSDWQILSGFYGRLLAAAAIVDVTLSIIVAGMYRLFAQKHPDILAAKSDSAKHSWLKILLLIVVFFFFVGPMILWLIVRAAFGAY